MVQRIRFGMERKSDPFIDILFPNLMNLTHDFLRFLTSY